MKPILVLYATREGQTRRIAEHVATTIRAHEVEAQVQDVVRVTTAIDPAAYQAVVLAASIHGGKHEREMAQFVKQHRQALEQLPTVFLSTSLTEAGAEDTTRSELERARAHAAAEKMIQAFFIQTGFRPTAYKPVAGSLLYSQYNWLVRLVMRRAVKAHGGTPTTTPLDREYTDWVALDGFIESLVSRGFGQGAGRAQP